MSFSPDTLSRLSSGFPFRPVTGFVFLILIPALWLSSCGPTTETIVVDRQARAVEDDEEEEVVEEDELRVLKIGESNRIRSMDPLFAVNTATKRMIQLSYEGLVKLDEEENAVPAAASRWEVSDDSLTYTFFLRDDLFFHDDESFSQGRGRKVNSRDVKRVFERMASRDVPPNAAELFMDNIRGFESYFLEQRDVYFDEDRQIDSISGIEAKNDSTIVFHLSEQDPAFLSYLATPYAVIYPREPFRFRDDGLHSHAVGTGPFRYSTTVGDSIHIFNRNESFNRKDDEGRTLPRAHRVELMSGIREAHLYSHFNRGVINILPDPGPGNIQRMITSENELKDPYRDKYKLQPQANPEPLVIRYNQNNRFNIGRPEAAAVLRHVTGDTLYKELGVPSLEITYQDDEYSQSNIARVFNRFGEDAPDRLVFAYQQDILPRTLSETIYDLMDDNLRVDLIQRRVFSRDIFLYLDYIPVYTSGQQPERQPQEVMRLESDRYLLKDKTVDNVKLNTLSWWMDLTQVRKTAEPAERAETAGR